jgi:cytochrome c oxidase subunit II
MQVFRRRAAALLASVALAVLFGLSLAPQAHAQAPHQWEIGMQPAHSPVEAHIHDLNALLTTIIVVITGFVGVLLLYVLFRYNVKRNPVASRISHNTLLEAIWTVVPVLILVAIAIPSFRLVYFEDRTHNPDMTIKVTGHQWFWEYTYPDQGGINFQSYMIQEEQLKPGQLRQLTVDNPLVVPVGKNIRILTTSGDVIHSFFIPSLGVQRYAIPGRTIETWVRVDQPGDYYGECNQICGINHSAMPIAVHALSSQDFEAWVRQAKTKFSNAGLDPGMHLAQAETAR